MSRNLLLCAMPQQDSYLRLQEVSVANGGHNKAAIDRLLEVRAGLFVPRNLYALVRHLFFRRRWHWRGLAKSPSDLQADPVLNLGYPGS